ncbi:hypothetical protein GSI_03015 [Ganoderma sinense ZZ0214-1]|uniref:MFS general substrate transporter n=1 Tax=Ganoderma sinense ZZ0214-1 TaxID=1077348 RepID=A0A2G8SN76_9APHY|nr:hypothetical protein GSI_03015 [Ganoderma sinense ZZ0214-1]
MSFFRTPLFVTFADVLQGLAYFPVSLYIAMFTRALSNEFTASVVLSLFNASASIGQICRRQRYRAFVLWGLANATIYLYLFAVVFGSLSGGFTSTWTNAAYECSGSSPEYAGIVFYGMSLARSVSAIIGGGGSSFGGRFGKFGYGAVEIFVGSCALATGASSVAVAFARRRITATPVA